MRRILVTGGTAFVSKYVAEFFVNMGETVYVLNRNQHEQFAGVTLICADRHNLGNILKQYAFDVVIDVNAYNATDVKDLLEGLGDFGEYILISSSAVYPEHLKQPFREEQQVGENIYWGKYGIGKIEAETYLKEHVKSAYIVRPPYLYGLYNNVYREAFVFDCAMSKRKFYLPQEGNLKLQFFHVRDLCRVIENILEKKPLEHILNVGNPQMVSVYEWVQICYDIINVPLEVVHVPKEIGQRNYFCFADYEYQLDVSRQAKLLPDKISLKDGLCEAFVWYSSHKEEVRRKDYIRYIEDNLKEI